LRGVFEAMRLKGAVDADGNLYVSEWLIGGRYSKLAAHR